MSQTEGKVRNKQLKLKFGNLVTPFKEGQKFPPPPTSKVYICQQRRGNLTEAIELALHLVLFDICETQFNGFGCPCPFLRSPSLTKSLVDCPLFFSLLIYFVADQVQIPLLNPCFDQDFCLLIGNHLANDNDFNIIGFNIGCRQNVGKA